MQLQTVLDNFVKAYNAYVYYPTNKIKALDFINLDTLISYTSYTEDETTTVKVSKDVIKEKYGVRLVPQIVYYKEKQIKDSDLAATPDAIKDSKFFNSLLKAAGKSIDTITQAYEKAKKAPSFKKKFKDSINEALEEKVSKKFNALYFHATLTQEYSFEIDLGKDEIYLAMEKNGNTITLSQQSTGFKWFFNFFFNFLYAADLQPGDIVLMDEPDAHLAIPAKRELRRFLKDFAKSTGVTFIATTQHPEFIDPDFLDELRIVKNKREEGEVGAGIQNKFYAIDENDADTINEVLIAFGLQHRDIITDPNNTVVYVEGITDYNYLTAFKLLKQHEEGKKIALAFLPIGGLGEDKEQMKKKIPVLARHKDAVLLTDSDKAADIFKETCEADARAKDRLKVFQLRDFDPRFAEIESLFAPADMERHKDMIEAKNKKDGNAGSASALFKRNIFDLDKKEEIHGQTKANFYRVLEYLASVK